MARAATTTDAFNAVAEPRRREILDLLAQGERPVNDLVAQLGLAQPQVSKHLRVLREVDLVRVRDHGRQRLYRLNAAPLKPLHDWLRRYERAWSDRFDLMDAVLEDLKERDDPRAADRLPPAAGPQGGDGTDDMDDLTEGEHAHGTDD
ncbi:ArsR/SmtB family transcription factor [Krasilnikovia sp. M28-CT-15]|uniref:ArsR/SmtB family transcription factor n=1 Tax=Krasilnikovia sp. M28-CT-15 TaxID=3373540 RepID=UPI00399CDF48